VKSIAKCLGTNIRLRRKELGLSLEELANLIEMEWTSIQRIETAKNWPKLPTVQAIAKALKTTEMALFQDPVLAGRKQDLVLSQLKRMLHVLELLDGMPHTDAEHLLGMIEARASHLSKTKHSGT
jgi:transcriptional regulator with XRE-family HTH domain